MPFPSHPIVVDRAVRGSINHHVAMLVPFASARIGRAHHVVGYHIRETFRFLLGGARRVFRRILGRPSQR